MNKKVTVGLAGVLVVLFGVLASLFYQYRAEMNQKQAELTTQLAEAQLELKQLKAEPETETAMEETIPAMAEEEEKKKLPFAADPADWKYILVNELNPMPRGFEVELADIQNGQKVDKRIKKPLEDMIAAAKKEGLNLLICSSYRTFEKQDRLMQQSIQKYKRAGMSYEEAFFKTKEQIALTGASEHHTGLAVDVVGVKHQSLDRAQANTKEAIWLNAHASDYGFVLRYPADKEELTMISFESWHYRYVGKEAAAYMKKNNLCLEEFAEILNAQQERDGKQDAMN